MATKVHLFKFVFLLFFFVCRWTAHAAQYWNITLEGDSLKPGDTLNSSSRLLSAEEKFYLLFATMPVAGTTQFLVIMDASNDGGGNFVYVANAGNPIAQDSGVLTLDSAGTLKITRKGEDPIILYFSTQPTMNTIATLLDSGNLILKEVHSDGSTKRVLWQSFDHPIDTLLPNMKLGVNHKTGQTWSLTCWLADQIIAPGPFTLEWDPKGRELIIRRRGVIYWTSGNRFQNMLLDKTMYNFMVATNGDEEYFSYNNTGQSQQSEWMIDQMGELQDIKGSSIARADLCYGYNTNGGCQRWKQPECRHRGDTFELKSGVFYTEESSFLDSQSLSTSDCRHACWSNCSCVAFSSLFDNGTGCAFWTETLSFIQGDSGTVYFLSPNHSHRGKLTSSLC